jgi:hypothetical protein
VEEIKKVQTNQTDVFAPEHVGHDRDQASMFLSGQYRRPLMNETDIQRTAEATLVLSPQ